MGNSVSHQHVTPKRLLHCLNDETLELDDELLLLYLTHKHRHLNTTPIFTKPKSPRIPIHQLPTKKKRRRSVKKHGLYQRTADGTLQHISPKKSQWYNSFVLSPSLQCPEFQRHFRSYFRMTFDAYLSLLPQLTRHPLFSIYAKSDATSVPSSPIELVLLGALRYFGLGWPVDEFMEMTALSAETHRRFFHIFIKFGATDMFEKYVRERHDNGKYEFSTATVSIANERAGSRLTNAENSGRNPHAFRTYVMTVNSKRKILSSELYNEELHHKYDTTLKDVESTFQMMKGRFRILKTGLRIRGVEATDRVWKTCCALHNMLLESDGLPENWPKENVSDWEGELGWHSNRYVQKHLPKVLLQYYPDTMSRRMYDCSNMGVEKELRGPKRLRDGGEIISV